MHYGQFDVNFIQEGPFPAFYTFIKSKFFPPISPTMGRAALDINKLRKLVPPAPHQKKLWIWNCIGIQLVHILPFSYYFGVIFSWKMFVCCSLQYPTIRTKNISEPFQLGQSIQKAYLFSDLQRLKLRFGILELLYWVTKLSYAKWRHTLSY